MSERLDEILTVMNAASEDFVLTLYLPLSVEQDQAAVEEHQFVEGWKLEALHPAMPTVIRPATVTKVFNRRYFLVELDDVRDGSSRESYSVCCHARSLNVFPVGWCASNGMKLATVPGE
jgi:hypothetical protein